MGRELRASRRDDEGQGKRPGRMKRAFSRMRKGLVAGIVTVAMVASLGVAACSTEQKCQSVTSCGDAAPCMTVDASTTDGNVNDANVQDANVNDANVSDANVTSDASVTDADGSVSDADVTDANTSDASLSDGGFTDASVDLDANMSVDADLEDAAVDLDGTVDLDANMSMDGSVVDDDAAVDEDAGLEDGGTDLDGSYYDPDAGTPIVLCDPNTIYDDYVITDWWQANVIYEVGGLEFEYVAYQPNPWEVTIEVTCDGSAILYDDLEQGVEAIFPLQYGKHLRMTAHTGNINFFVATVHVEDATPQP